MARFKFGFDTGARRNKFRSGLGGRSRGTGGTRGPRAKGGFSGFKKPSFGGAFGVDFTLDSAKSYFFDRDDWDEIFSPAELKALRITGAWLRRAARGMIRSRKKESKPDRPPTRWADRDAFASLTNILYAVDPFNHTVIVGPIFLRSTHKKVYTFPHPTIPATLEFGGRVRVGYDTVTRRGEFLPKNRVVTIAKRPYMSRALEKKRDKIIELFEDLIGRTPQCWEVASRLRPAA